MNFTNPFLQLYLEYVEDTESPRIMHIWSALSSISACLGRRVYYEFNIENIFPNMYVVLVGPPAVHKGVAMELATRALKNATKVRFAPLDTGGQRQGLITAMAGGDLNDEDGIQKVLDTIELNGSASLENLDELRNIQLTSTTHPADRHVLFSAQPELGGLLGTNNINLLRFLNVVYDGKDYPYQLKKVQQDLKEPLLGMIACTTPSEIADCVPKESIGQGFTSRIIFVYADQVYRDIPRPKLGDEKLAKEIENTLSELYFNFHGPIARTKEADELMDSLYKKKTELVDSRFQYYLQRRQQHHIKVSMNLTCARKSMQMEASDVQEADNLLDLTETTMPQALGEFGISPISAVKQKIVEFVRFSNGTIDAVSLYMQMHREVRNLADFQMCLADLVNSGAIIQVATKKGTAYTVKQSDADTRILLNALSEKEESDEKIIPLHG